MTAILGPVGLESIPFRSVVFPAPQEAGQQGDGQAGVAGVNGICYSVPVYVL